MDFINDPRFGGIERFERKLNEELNPPAMLGRME